MADHLPENSDLLLSAIRKRAGLFNDPDTDAYRLFNGFHEGTGDYSVDRYGSTAVILWSSRKKIPGDDLKAELCRICMEAVPGIESVLFKNRYAPGTEEKKGILLAGGSPARQIREWGINYPVNLTLNKDCGFYLDSSLLRRWLLEHAEGKRVLNTFAYTGSLGDAAESGGALSVTQTDLNANYLSARHSTQEYLIGDFFHVTSALRRSGRLFDLIILDPPFFADAGRGGKVNTAGNMAALVNKIRPLAAHGAKIVTVSNALFLSGKDHLSQLESLCGPWLSFGGIIPVPESFFGYSPIRKESLPADPAPFNHSTKILVLDIRRKDERL